MIRDELLQTVRDLLSSAGFYVSEVYDIRPIGFDIVARRDNSLLIIKVLTNINSFSEDVSIELKKLAYLLQAHPLLIGLRTGTGHLEEDVVYDRFGIQTINPETLKHHLLEGLPLRIYAAPGGYYVNLDKNKLIELRQKHQYSLGSLARTVRVSRRMVRMYEDGVNARVDVAIRIENVFGDALIKPIDILSNTSNQTVPGKGSSLVVQQRMEKLQEEIFSILRKIGYTIIPLGRCPFEAVSKEHEKILLTCIQPYDKKIVRKAQVVSSISAITEKQAVLFTDRKGNHDNIRGTPLIIKRELRRLKDPEDIMDLILERMCS
ncbi:MAG: transcriptional regulator [Candidatus Thermoplasmatota archaeon]|nr:transcriptional regulator [Candidatus Thermoplasmatota archaeon]